MELSELQRNYWLNAGVNVLAGSNRARRYEDLEG